MTKLLKITPQRWLIILSLLIITPLGILSKYYSGLGEKWVHDYSGAILYEIFWCLLIFFIIPNRQAITRITLGVFSATCALELLQLWQTPLLAPIRASLIGKFLLGTTFVWWDFLYYAIGSLLGWLWLRQISQFRKLIR
ncbi:DUF2809 domain-containing protein [Moorena sp. SIO4G3]|uniref:ribosomal maturation YjgA family protein n=1 Tax=Moorena sp. SIO4G3 TaxID=2607821 RepID=UPI00142BBD36|nr:DUF2809 domain-containing protein [Moorena sp. SIO4G3]NEO79446.1 DUF2809 domain-containing protein [Moorena sp. SIO4G3]